MSCLSYGKRERKSPRQRVKSQAFNVKPQFLRPSIARRLKVHPNLTPNRP